jgi:hypothetical protein
MKTLNDIQTKQLLKRLDPFELSYETISHKKVYPKYDIALAIPSGKKYCAWFSFDNENDVCYLMDYSRNQKINKISIVQTAQFNRELCLGTLLYGTLVDIGCTTIQQYFVIEDIFHYKGISLKSMLLSEKLGYLEKVMESINPNTTESTIMQFALPFMWGIVPKYSNNNSVDINENLIISEYDNYKDNIAYNTHHIQIRKLNEISPYINIQLNLILSKMGRDKSIANPTTTTNVTTKNSVEIPLKPYTMAFHKPQYKDITTFHVMADIQYDIYHLYAFGKNNTSTYYGVAGIPTIKTSVYMNKLFRNIKENQNIDYIEESDDEDDFENIDHAKYVDLNKKIIMECVFHNKFKKWVPVHVCTNTSRIVHISKLVNNYV